MSIQEVLDEAEKEQQLLELAEKLFPGRVSFGTKSFICDCCGSTHHESTVTVKDKRK